MSRNLRKIQRGNPTGSGDPLRSTAGGSPPAAGSNPNFTYVNSGVNNGEVYVTLNGVTAGNLIVVFFYGAYPSPPSNITCSDGTSTLQKATLSNGTYATAQIFYILSSVASGNVTYTISDDTGSEPATFAYEFSYTGTIALDQENHNAADSGTSYTTNSITTTGGSNSQLMIAGISHYGGGTLSAQSIAGTGASGIIESTGETATTFYRIVTANTNGAGTATASSGGYWAGQIVSFK